MNEIVIAKETCPNCKNEKNILTYRKYQIDDKTIMSTPDIFCGCGECLRPIVPLFKVSESGMQLSVMTLEQKKQFRCADGVLRKF